jgi:hypothetical protein
MDQDIGCGGRGAVKRMREAKQATGIQTISPAMKVSVATLQGTIMYYIPVRLSGHRPFSRTQEHQRICGGPLNVTNCERRLHPALLCFHFLRLHVFEYIYHYTSFTETMLVVCFRFDST